jgi:hypothetical protein
LAAVASLIVRYRRSGSVQREQLKWLLYATALVVAGLVANFVIGGLVSDHATAANLENAFISVGAVSGI